MFRVDCTLDQAMLNHFAVEWKTKTGMDILSSHKAKLRLLVAIDKVSKEKLDIFEQKKLHPKMIFFDT
jgi:hypothetical protein